MWQKPSTVRWTKTQGFAKGLNGKCGGQIGRFWFYYGRSRLIRFARLRLWLVALNPAIFHPAISERGMNKKHPGIPRVLHVLPWKNISRFGFIMVEAWAFDSQPGRLLKQLLELGLKGGPVDWSRQLKNCSRLRVDLVGHDHGLWKTIGFPDIRLFFTQRFLIGDELSRVGWLATMESPTPTKRHHAMVGLGFGWFSCWCFNIF